MAAPTVSVPYTGQGYYATPQPLRHSGHDTGDLSAHPYLSHGVKLEHPTTPDIPHGLDHYHHSQPRTSPLGLPVASSLASQQPLGSYAAMSAYQSHWPATASTSSASSSFGTGSANVDGASNAFALPILHTLSDAHSNEDEYEDGDELGDLPALAASGGSTKHSERSIRRRSSKACDQCRKSKCKCERQNANEPCKNCVLLNTPCTFLGPSRKRGPPKGYIDAIEARLHQTEALLGILIGCGDSRAQALLADLAQDPLAKEIIDRVDNSPYGVAGRRRGVELPVKRAPMRSSPPAPGEPHMLGSTHPSNEWQDSVIARLRSTSLIRMRDGDSGYTRSASAEPLSRVQPSAGTQQLPARSTPSAHSQAHDYAQSQDARSRSPSRQPRQRRRVDFEEAPVALSHPESDSRSRFASPSFARSDAPTNRSSSYGGSGVTSPVLPTSARASPPRAVDQSDDESDDLADAVGQLSLNEDAVVRYHGRTSGLHLLAADARRDGRNSGGLWRFPGARVWPPLPESAKTKTHDAKVLEEIDDMAALPPKDVQEKLLNLYWVYVHPSLPIVHKEMFVESFRSGIVGGREDTEQFDSATNASVAPWEHGRPRRIPTLLLLAMFSVAARYDHTDSAHPLPTDANTMWTAGDDYLRAARELLQRSSGASRPLTCKALLLLGYREIGIGAMAHAWAYIGSAVRMAQDLGMHKCADRWSHQGGSLFGPRELQERSRIWYACVVMDTYVSTYIGRPVAVFERDFDTSLPSEAEPEETELWQPHTSVDSSADAAEGTPGHLISCFNQSADLSILLSRILQTIYAVRPPPGRYAELLQIEQRLDRWYINLPAHLQYEPGSSRRAAPPHVLNLHMQYWTVVLLLHRPFVKNMSRPGSESGREELDVRATCQKNYDMCVRAANQITSIASVFMQAWSMQHAPVYPCYYLFTAGIMHVNSLNSFPDDPQARAGLSICMDALKKMSIIWPSAKRAWDLFEGCRANAEAALPLLTTSLKPDDSPSRKRPADATGSDDDENYGYPAQRLGDYGAQQYRPTLPQAVSPETTGAPFYFNAQQVAATAYDRWAAGSGGFGGSLSTSVLPQQYSTGLADTRRGEQVLGVPVYDAQGRYPSFWNDYTSLGQLGLAYADPVLPQPQPQSQQHYQQTQNPAQGHPMQSQQQQQTTMAQQQQYYDMFNS